MIYIHFLFFLIGIWLFIDKAMLGNKTKQLNNFSKDISLRLKGILAIGIVFGHLCGLSQIPIPLFGNFGTCLVSVFLFITGYGLMSSLVSKKNYFENYFRNRVLIFLSPPLGIFY